MRLAPAEFIDAGVDWATFTAPSHSTGTEIASRAEVFIGSERERGCFLRPWSMSGYEGFKCGSVAAGIRADGGIVRLGGHLAQQHWRWFYEVAENCSRLDLQATFRFPQEASTVVTSTYRGVLNHRRKHRRGPTVSIWKEAGGSATLYFGKRCSERFGRIYDKGLESKLAHYQNCVRFEVEIKGRPAWSNICDIAKESPALSQGGLQSLEVASICGRVGSYFTDLGVRMWPAEAKPSLLRSAANRSSSQQALEWLRSQVAPSVNELCSMGFANEVRSALFASGPAWGHTGESGPSLGDTEWDGPLDPEVIDEWGGQYGC